MGNASAKIKFKIINNEQKKENFKKSFTLKKKLYLKSYL